MHNTPIRWLIVSLLSTSCLAEERLAVKFTALPTAVQSTVSQYIDPKTITSIVKVSDIGYNKFEIESTKVVNNKDYIDTDLTVSNEGEIIKMAREAPFFDLPFPVMKQLNVRYPNLKVTEVEKVQKRYFHLTGTYNGQPLDINIDDDGEIREHSINQSKTLPSSDPQPPPN